MPLGPFVRKLLGPLERPAAITYRSLFVDFKSLVGHVEAWVPASEIHNILEIGCGEGMLVERLAKIYPKARILGIDINPRIGRLYKGPAKRVTFRQQTINDFAAENPSTMDFVIISDVMHHIPPDGHRELLSLAKCALKKDGYFILKDWARKSTPIHLIAYFADRYITGDRVFYRTADELRDLVKNVFGSDSIKDEVRIGPWKNNIVLLARKCDDDSYVTGPALG